MRIAIDAREAAGRPTGVGRYLMSLLDQWRQPDDVDCKFSLYLDDRPMGNFAPPADRFPVTRLRRWPDLVPGRDTLWQQVTLARRVRRDRPDVFFSPAYSLPLRLTCPSVVTVHDISFEAHPEWYPRRQGLRLRQTCRRACRSARLVLTISEFSRQELMGHYGLPPERVAVVPLAANDRFRPREDRSAETRIRRKLGIRGRIVLHAGTILNRRMVPLVLEAFGQVLKTEPDLALVFAGENRSWPAIDLFSLAARFGVDDRVSAPGYIGDDDLAALYSAADLTIYLSQYEGFGLPPLEALASGCRVITTSGHALQENFQGLATLFQGSGAGALAQEILDQLALASVEPWEGRLDRSRRAATRYSWERTATETLALIRRAAGEDC